MLIVLVYNDGTGTDAAANYDVEVRVNHVTIWRGRVSKHDRSEGWPAQHIATVASLGNMRVNVEQGKHQGEESAHA